MQTINTFNVVDFLQFLLIRLLLIFLVLFSHSLLFWSSYWIQEFLFAIKYNIFSVLGVLDFALYISIDSFQSWYLSNIYGYVFNIIILIIIYFIIYKKNNRKNFKEKRFTIIYILSSIIFWIFFQFISIQ
jgi:phosphotransferase system  glucose/maltose/N-acetylglucosamine-specific IIC component